MPIRSNARLRGAATLALWLSMAAPAAAIPYGLLDPTAASWT